jgi:hypothetical protein
MNKEQFKKSILDLLNYYIEQVVGFNITAKDAQENNNEAILSMIQTQAQAAGYAFEQSLDGIIATVFPEDESEIGEDESEDFQMMSEEM